MKSLKTLLLLLLFVGSGVSGGYCVRGVVWEWSQLSDGQLEAILRGAMPGLEVALGRSVTLQELVGAYGSGALRVDYLGKDADGWLMYRVAYAEGINIALIDDIT